MIKKLKFKVKEHFPKSQRTGKMVKAAVCFLVAIMATVSVNVSAQQKVDLVQIVKASHVIRAGTEITVSDLEEVEAVGYGLPKDVLTSKEQVTGKYAAADIYPSDPIIPAKLTDAKADPFLSLAADKNIVSFTVKTLAASVAGNIKAGDMIQVVYAASSIDATSLNSQVDPVEPDCLRRLTVVDIKDSDGYYADSGKEGNSIIKSSAKFIPSTITVLADEIQAKELYKAELTGNIYVRFIER